MKQEKEVGYYDPSPKKETLRQVAEKFAKGVDGVIVKTTRTPTPQEKAVELLHKFNYESKHYLMLDAKQCALIAVDEILQITWVDKFLTVQDYWNEVKQELTKQQEQ
jgi:hypothetical protein